MVAARPPHTKRTLTHARLRNRTRGAVAQRILQNDKVVATVNALLVLLIIAVLTYPLIFVLVASVSNPQDIYSNTLPDVPRSVTLVSYSRVFENRSIWLGYRNTVIYTLVGTLVSVTLTVLGAYPLSRRKFYGKGPVTFLFVFTIVFNGGLIPTYLLVRNLGMINTIWSIVIPNAVSVFNLVVVRTYMQTQVPEELYEAAYIDGCGDIYLLFKVVLPLSIPVVSVIALFYAVGQWNSYFSALIYLTEGSRYPLQLILREILISSEMDSMVDVVSDERFAERLIAKEGIKYAVVVVSSLPMLVIYPFIKRFFEKGIMVGALKG